MFTSFFIVLLMGKINDEKNVDNFKRKTLTENFNRRKYFLLFWTRCYIILVMMYNVILNQIGLKVFGFTKYFPFSVYVYFNIYITYIYTYSHLYTHV